MPPLLLKTKIKLNNIQVMFLFPVVFMVVDMVLLMASVVVSEAEVMGMGVEDELI